MRRGVYFHYLCYDPFLDTFLPVRIEYWIFEGVEHYSIDIGDEVSYSLWQNEEGLLLETAKIVIGGDDIWLPREGIDEFLDLLEKVLRKLIIVAENVVEE